MDQSVFSGNHFRKPCAAGHAFFAKRRMRLTLPISALVCLAACSDNIIGPNTDVGLSVWAEVSPTSVSIRDSTAVLRIRVYVSNTSIVEIRVVSGGPPYRFTADPDRSQGLWGSYRIANDVDPLNAGPSVDWWGDSVYVFTARHTDYNERLVSLSDWKAGGWTLAPGRYRVRSWFNGREGKSATFDLTP
jgi:hypothetical protein